MMRWVVPVLLAVAAAAGTTACGTTITGTAPSAASATGVPSAGLPDDIDPCALLDPTDQAALGASGLSDADHGSLPGCQGRLRPDARTTLRFAMYVADSTFEEYERLGSTEPLPDIGRHRALIERAPDPPASCMVVVAIRPAEIISTSVFDGTDIALLCDLALRIAEAIEPDLPG